MKKLLSIITGFSLLITPSLFAISCSSKVQVISKFDDITSIKNTGAFKNNQAFISRNELKEIVSSNNTTSSSTANSAALMTSTSTTSTQTNNNNDLKYASERLKALAANNFTKNKKQAWDSLQSASMTFYKKVEPTAVNVLGYEQITKDNVTNLDKELKTVFLVFKDNTKETEKLEVELLPEINTNNGNKVIDNGSLYLDLLEKPENLKLANQKSIIEVLRPEITKIKVVLQNTKNNNSTNKEDIKNTEVFNLLIKQLSIYLANAVKYFNSESGIITTSPTFSYKTRSNQIYDYIVKNKKDELYKKLETAFATEFNKINFIDIFKDFQFDENNSNDNKKITTKIIKSSTNSSTSSSNSSMPSTTAPNSTTTR
ncbi:lipoprotein [Mycoplasma mycoides]|uniref:lipoprotein n=1 Tax=Mycoplasma mycoides TaxID=2102 RepID=UPI002240046F|nr:lipoprotein [Mycoplasma mycoides]QVK05308.1 lipoprotein [Mycoplasma mycoides subsp. capri]QVK08619.1 lipoprotein [Mycoplasma mycoides subsp. capri]